MKQEGVLTDDEELLKEARERFKLAVEAEASNRADALDDLNFLSGDQWTTDAKKSRAGRPCLTINRLPQYIRSVVNEQRKTRPAIDVIPADGQSSKETADVLQGLIRHIERSSRAKIAYDTAFKYAVSCGFGHFRITTAYCDDDSFDQEIRIGRINNPFTVYRDPMSTQPDHSDDLFTFITELVDRKEFKAKYGFEPGSIDDVGSGDEISAWFEADKVRIAEYWRIIESSIEIHALSTGQQIEGKLDSRRKSELAAMGVKIVKSRVAQKRTVEQYLMTCDKIIKKSEWKGKYIPIVTVIGDELNIEGDTKLESLTRFAKDPARMYNYWASAETELVAMQPKAPWIAPQGSFDGFEAQWARANTESMAYLEYVPIAGQPAPQRQFFTGLPAGVREGRMAAAEDIKAVTGLFDASLGARSNETSGVAIRAREEQGDNATYHFIDNQALAIEFAGKIIIDLAPHIYDTARVVNIITPSNEQQAVMINQTFIDPATGQEKLYDMHTGKYAVTVRVGPSFESKRQEMTQSMIELSTSNPQLMEIAGDLVMKNMDWPQAEEIAERIKMMMPPQLRGEQPPPDPQKQLLDAQVQLEQAKAQAANEKAQSDAQLKQMDMQLKQAELRMKEMELQFKGHELEMTSAMQHEQIGMQREEMGMKRMEMTGSMALPGSPEAEQEEAQKQAEMMMEKEACARRDATAEALLATMVEAVKVLSAPKKIALERDSGGRPTGAISAPVMVQ